jgi:hypothetical protein
MALTDIVQPFIWGGSGKRMTPEEIARQREIAQSLMAVDTSPVAHWTQGAARMANALVGRIREGRADAAATKNAEDSKTRIAKALAGLGGGAGFPSAVAAGASPTSGIATGTTIATPEAATIRQGLVARGLPEHVADAFVLNFKDESGLNPAINEKNPVVPGSRGGYGLYQLTGPRRTAYEQFAAQRGVDPSNVDAQLDFLMTELQGPEAKAAQSILSAPDTATAAQAIVNDFLRPAPEHRAARAARYAKLGNGVQVASLDQSVGTQASPRGGATFTADAYDPSNYRGNAPANGARATFNDPMLNYDERGARMEAASYAPQQRGLADRLMDDPNARPLSEEERAARLRKMEEIAPLIDGTAPGRPAVATTAAAAINQIAPQQVAAKPNVAAAALLRQHDMALGGALAGNGQAQRVTDASGYFPPAPSVAGSPAPAAGGFSPAIIEMLSSPYASKQEQNIAALLLNQQFDQQQRAAQMQAARDNWLFQQQYEDQAQARDPLRQLQMDKARMEIEAFRNPQPKLTDDMREYETAKKQGFPGTFMDYQIKMKEAGRSQVNIDTGEKLPSGYRWIDNNDRAKGVEPIPGGPATQIPGELAARIGMADSFIEQADGLKKSVMEGQLTGPVDAAMAKLGIGAQGQYYRQLQSGADALMRLLTGAGMNKEEATQYAERYLPTTRDTAESAAQKIDQLVRELEAAKGMAMRGRGTTTPLQSGPKRINSQAEFEALPSGAEFIAPDGSVRKKP